ncbi:MAG: hypothetical protein U0326_10475 [Polyangiales bacterium]
MTSLPVLGLALALATSAEAQPYASGVSSPPLAAPQQVDQRPWTRRFGFHVGLDFGIGGGEKVAGVLFGAEVFAHYGPVVFGGLVSTTGLSNARFTTLAAGLGLRVLTSNAPTHGSFELIGLLGRHAYENIGKSLFGVLLGSGGNPGVSATLPFAGARLSAGVEWGRSPRLFAGLSVTVDRDLSTQTITHSWTETHRPLLCFSECTTTSTETETVTLGQLNVTVTLLNVRIVFN